MLVLTRGRGEQITIGQAGQVLTSPILVTLLDVRGHSARIGIDAEREVPVFRSELIEREHHVMPEITDSALPSGLSEIDLEVS